MNLFCPSIHRSRLNRNLSPMGAREQTNQPQAAPLLFAPEILQDRAPLGGNDLLLHAVRMGQKEVCRHLLATTEADVNGAVPDTGETPLMLAAREGHLDLFRYLVEQGADPNATNHFGTTPLMYAAYNGNLEICKYLVEDLRVEVETKDHDGDTALWYAYKNLLQADPTQQSQDPRLSLMAAARPTPQFLPNIETSQTPGLAVLVLDFLGTQDLPLVASVNRGFERAVRYHTGVRISPHENNIQRALGKKYLSLDEQNRFRPTRHVTDLNFTGCAQLCDEDLGWVCEFFPDLKTLKLGGCTGLTDAGFVHIGKLKILRHLDLSGCKDLTGAGFLHIGPLFNLQYLDLSGCLSLKDADLKHVGQLKNLQHLDLSGCKDLTGAGFFHVRTLENLQYLDVHGCQGITGSCFVHIGTLKNLQHLDLSGCACLTDADFVNVAQLKNLEYLDVSKCRYVTDGSFKEIVHLENLQYLALRGCVRLVKASLKYLARLKNLRHLDLSENIFIDADFRGLSQLAHLQYLNVSGCLGLKNAELSVFRPEVRIIR